MNTKLLINFLESKSLAQFECRNPSLGLMTKAGSCKSAGQEGGPGDTSYTPKSVGECERMSLHTPK